jgi:hypothetical protein
MIRFWKFCYSKNKNIFFELKINKDDPELKKWTQKMFIYFIFFGTALFLSFILMAFSTGCLKKVGYLT